MTLIVALEGSDGLVIAADSRGTIGDPRGLTAINDTQIKLFQLSKYCGIGVSGAGEIAANLVNELKKAIAEQKLEHVGEIQEATRLLARNLYGDWFSKFEITQRPTLTLTIVGYAKDDSTKKLVPGTYLLVSQQDFAPLLFPNGNCLTGVPQYAVYLMHRFYDPAMTVEDLCRLAAYLISETATQDPKVGGPIKIATVKPAAGYRELSAADIERINRKNDSQSEAMKRSFIKTSAKQRVKR